MSERIRTHVRSNVVGYVALFIALSGVAYAGGLKKNSVKSKQIKNGQVLSKDIGDGEVGGADLANGSVGSDEVAAGAISSSALADGSVTTPRLANGAVTGGKLAASSVNASKVGANALGGADINESSLLGVDAATLGGIAAGGFALAGHEHDSTYVNESQADSVDAAMISNTTRAIQIPLRSWIECDTNAGADINFTSGADAFPDFINRNTDGEGFLLGFDADAANEDQDVSVCAQVTVPPDYSEAGSRIMHLYVRASKDGNGGAIENLVCGFSNNGGSFQSQTTIPIDSAGQVVYECPGSFLRVAHDVVAIALTISSPTTINNQVDILGVELDYPATQ